MNESQKRNRVRRSDYDRVLLTETLPFETPVIFSNEGLYDLVSALPKSSTPFRRLIESLVMGSPTSSRYTVPFHYKIRKSTAEFRRLALLHPQAQWRIRSFYEKYEHVMLFHCSRSTVSIRSPDKVTSSYYFRGQHEHLNQYRHSSFATVRLDDQTKHSPSFFSYRGYDRLYRFFHSPDYLDLERRFRVMRTLDVAKCFDSIYTHCLSWAIKDKDFTKSYKNVSGTFAQQFDLLLQFANQRETNGIAIGPEVSRIFAELIFQEVDRRAIARLESIPKPLFLDTQYAMRRYVDDVFIFSLTDADAKRIYDVYADVLLEFNLHANTTKSIVLSRPFVTVKSRLIQQASDVTNDFVGKFLDPNSDGSVLIPRTVRARWKLIRSYIENIKSLCSFNQLNYDEIAAFLIAVLNERIKKIVAIEGISDPETSTQEYLNALLVLLEAIFFFYKVSPSVSASYRVCTSLVLVSRFTKAHLPGISATLSQHAYEWCETLLGDLSEFDAEGIEGFLPLEAMNVLMAMRDLGNDYLLPPSTVLQFFNGKNSPNANRLNYFSIVCGLYYVRDDRRYAETRNVLLSAASRRLDDVADIGQNSEKAHLLLDLLCCPYIEERTKRAWIRRSAKALGLGSFASAEVNTIVSTFGKSHVHIRWSDIDLLNSLEKKELKRAY